MPLRGPAPRNIPQPGAMIGNANCTKAPAPKFQTRTDMRHYVPVCAVGVVGLSLTGATSMHARGRLSSGRSKLSDMLHCKQEASINLFGHHDSAEAVYNSLRPTMQTRSSSGDRETLGQVWGAQSQHKTISYCMY
eukprot:5987681-Amphidinium_carterae.1